MTVRYRLAAFDLDGTLLDSGNQVSEGNAAALRAVAGQGVTVCPATARWYQAAVRPFEGLGLAAPAIASGGADVRLAGGAVVAQHLLPPEFVALFATLCGRAGWTANLSTRERTYRLAAESPPWAATAPPWLVPVTTLDGLDLSELLSALADVSADDPHLAELDQWRGRVSAHSAVAFNGPALLTLTARGVDKGSALRALCEAEGIDPAEAVVFGDSEVDLPMFDVAGLAVAMGNASDAVKARAGMVTATADEDGVAEAIGRIWPEGR